MNNFQCIAVDMGAASIRIMTGTVTDGKLSVHEASRFHNGTRQMEGHERWDIEYIIKEINKAVSGILAHENKSISSIGVDSWGVDFALLDKDGNLLDIPVAYRDSRTKTMQEKWTKIMPVEETFRKTGINFYDFNTLFQLLSIRDLEIIRRTAHILFLPCYVSYRLSGIMFNELTISSTSQILDVHGKKMNEEILRHLNLRPEHFGNILMPGTMAGNVKNGYILPSEVKMVAVCCHDTAGAVMAVPSERENYAFISTGTWCLAGMVSNSPVINTFALENGFTNERGFNNSFRILKNIIGLWLVQGLQSSFNNKYNYEEIAGFLENTKTDTLIFPDHELFYNPDNMKEAFDEFCRITSQALPATPGEYFKIAYDSLCCSFRDNMDKLENMLNTDIDIIHLIGGGIRSEYLCRQTANISRRKIIAGPVECSAIGNVLAQAIALKVINNAEEGRGLVRNSFDIVEYLPEEDFRGEYERKYKLYKGLAGG